MSRPRMLRPHFVERLPQPRALLSGECGEEAKKSSSSRRRKVFDCSHFGGAAVSSGLEEEDNFGSSRGQAPRGDSDRMFQRHSYVQVTVEDPVVVGGLVEQKLELEGNMFRCRRGRERASAFGDMDVGGQVEVSTVPRLGGLVRDVGVVANQCPAWEMLEDGGLVMVEDGDVDVEVVTRLLAEPSIGSPSAAEEPWRDEAEQQVAHLCNRPWYRSRRLARESIIHDVKLAPHSSSTQPIYAVEAVDNSYVIAIPVLAVGITGRRSHATTFSIRCLAH